MSSDLQPERFDFTSTVDAILSADALIRFKPVTPVVDVTGLVQIIQAMARKMDQMEAELSEQHSLTDRLNKEVAALRAMSDDTQLLRRDMKRIVNDVENITSQTRLQSQRVDRLRSDLDDACSQFPSGTATAEFAVAPSPPNRFEGFSTKASSAPVNQQRPVAGLDLVDSPHGLRVQAVKPGGPAGLAGFQPGDVIFAVDSEECATRTHFLNIMERSTIGQPHDVSYFRDGQRHMARLYLISGALESTRHPSLR